MLISAVMPIMSIYRLPHGQFGYKGHVINLPRDITTFATSLPRLPTELDILLVRKEGSDTSHRDFRVRRSVVLRALQWLKHHKKYYNSIEIDHAALSQLPTEGDLTGLHTMEDVTTDDEVKKPVDDQESQDIATFVPAAARKMTEQEVVRKSIVDDRRPTTVPWPSKGDAPINEFTTEGYMSCAFPTLLVTL